MVYSITERVGVIKPITPFHYFQILTILNNGKLLNIMFIFDNFCQSLSAVTSVKYECDKKRSAFAKVEIFQQETIEQTFGKPHPRSDKFCDIQQDTQNYEKAIPFNVCIIMMEYIDNLDRIGWCILKM